MDPVSHPATTVVQVGLRRLLVAALAAAAVLNVAARDDSLAPVLPPPDTPPNETSAPASAAPPQRTTLEANGFGVALDSAGFRQTLGYERFKRNYFRLAMFTTAPEYRPGSGDGFTFSLLVDDLPKEVKDLKTLFTHCMIANKLTDRLKDGSLQPLKSPRSAKGLLYRYPQRLPLPSNLARGGTAEFTQWHWYFESIQNGKWFEIHFSRGVALNAPVPEGVEAGIDRLLHSLEFFTAAPAK